MIVNTEENLILESIFLTNFENIKEPNVKRFRVQNYPLKGVIDKLLSEQLIKEKEQGYRLTLNGFAVLNSSSDSFNIVKSQCEAIFKVLKAHYLKFYGEPITVDSIAQQILVDKNKISSAVYYTSETSDLTCGRSTNLLKVDASLTPYEKVLDHENFESVLDVHRNWIRERLEHKQEFNGEVSLKQYELSQERTFLEEEWDIEGAPTQKNIKSFVHKDRIESLENLNLEHPDYDLSKVIQICYEMNVCYTNRCFFALASLQRMLIDHIPPIFNFQRFSEVANQHGSKSFKKHMSHLGNSLRNLSDSYLHQHIRKSETLPNEISIVFASAIDDLLSEVVRFLKIK